MTAIRFSAVIRFCGTMNGCSLLGGSARMRKIRYAVAMSLDGHIAGPNGEYDWIGADPEVDFAAIWSQFDTLLMGRRTFEAATKRLGEKAFQGIARIVFSRTMKP